VEDLIEEIEATEEIEVDDEVEEDDLTEEEIEAVDQDKKALNTSSNNTDTRVFF